MDEESTQARRRRLEGRADLLDATVLRYRLLQRALSSFRWKPRLRRNLDVLREVVRTSDEVEEAREVAARHAQREAWPPRAALRRCLEELEVLDGKLRRLCERRLGGREERLGSQLAALEAALRAESAGPLQRAALAHALLSARTVEVGRASLFGDYLEAQFKRPFDARAPIPYTREQAAALVGRLSEGEGALQALWQLLQSADRSGEMVRHYQRRARRAPVRPSRGPVEELLRAAFWFGLAQTRLREWVDAALSPLEVGEAEVLPVFVWLAARQESALSPLLATEAISSPRAAVLELAHGLWTALRGPVGTVAWERLLALAEHAGAAEDADLHRVEDALRLFLHVRDRKAAGALTARLAARRVSERIPGALVELVTQARQLLDRGTQVLA